MAVFRYINERLRGWRTLLTALFFATLGVLELTDWTQVIPDGPAKGWWILGISIIMAWLRVITRTPVGGEPAPKGDSIHE